MNGPCQDRGLRRNRYRYVRSQTARCSPMREVRNSLILLRYPKRTTFVNVEKTYPERGARGNVITVMSSGPSLSWIVALLNVVRNRLRNGFVSHRPIRKMICCQNLDINLAFLVGDV